MERARVPAHEVVTVPSGEVQILAGRVPAGSARNTTSQPEVPRAATERAQAPRRQACWGAEGRRV